MHTKIIMKKKNKREKQTNGKVSNRHKTKTKRQNALANSLMPAYFCQFDFVDMCNRWNNCHQFLFEVNILIHHSIHRIQFRSVLFSVIFAVFPVYLLPAQILLFLSAALIVKRLFIIWHLILFIFFYFCLHLTSSGIEHERATKDGKRNVCNFWF